MHKYQNRQLNLYLKQNIAAFQHHLILLGRLNTSHHYPVNHHNVTRRIVISPGGTRREEGGDGHDY